MSDSETLNPRSRPAKPPTMRVALKAVICVVSLMAVSPSALAVDGCLVLLCFAAPNWRAVPQCVPPIRQVLRDLARGRMFPTCAMAGSSNSASHQWAVAPLECPPQYTRLVADETSMRYACDYTGSVSVSINGSLWARTWWNMNGDTVTEYTSAAKARLGTWDTRFEDDYSAWQAMQPAPAAVCASC